MSDIGVLTKGYWKIPYYAVADTDLPLDAKGMLAYFCSFCSNDKDFCYPSRETIMTELNISKPTYLNSMRVLESRNYIIKGSYKKTNKITIVDHSSGAVPEKYGIVPKVVMENPAVSVKAKGIYAILSVLSRYSDECSRSNLCELAQTSKNSLVKYVNELISAGYITRNDQNRKNGEFSTSSYSLIGIDSTLPCTKILTSSDSPCTKIFTISGEPCTSSLTPPCTKILTMPGTNSLTPNKENITNNSLTASISEDIETQENEHQDMIEAQENDFVLNYEAELTQFLAEIENLSSSVDIVKEGSLYMLFIKQLKVIAAPVFQKHPGKKLSNTASMNQLCQLVSMANDKKAAAERLWVKSRDRFYERAGTTTINNIPAYLKAIIETIIESECVEMELKKNSSEMVISIDLSLPTSVARA